MWTGRRELPDEQDQAAQAPLPQRNPLDELERTPNLLRHTPPGVIPQRRGSSCGIQFFCITPIQAALNRFWDLSRHLSRLDKSQNLLHTIRDRGDAEATSVRRN